MKQIKKAELERLVNMINQLTHSPIDSYIRQKSGKYVANIGNYHLDWAYGGVETPLGQGYRTKRELYNELKAFIGGIQTK